MPDNVGGRIEAVATSDNGSALAIPTIRSRVDAELAKVPTPSTEDVVRTVAQPNRTNPRQGDPSSPLSLEVIGTRPADGEPGLAVRCHAPRLAAGPAGRSQCRVRRTEEATGRRWLEELPHVDVRRTRTFAQTAFVTPAVDGVLESTLSVVVTYDPHRGGPAVLGRWGAPPR
jgi:hypothetical protein